MNNQSPIGKFKTTIINMMNQLEQWVPRDLELEKHRMYLETALAANPRGTINLYMENMKPYASHIMEGDDMFFLKSNTEEMVDSEYVRLGERIKVIWKGLDDTQRNNLKKYSKLLLILGAIATKNENIRQIINKYRDPTNPLVF